MPQIRCPNCGCSINLETRKKMDFYLISKNLQSGSKSFTQLLHATQLPRKTLNLRLKDLVERGTIIRDNGYHLSEASRDAPIKHKMKRGLVMKSRISHFIKDNPNGNRDALLVGAFLAFLIAGPLLFAISSTVYAHEVHNFNLTVPAEGFVVTISISDAADLFAWQGKIRFDPDVLMISDVGAGDFLSSNALVINATGGFLTHMPGSAESTLVFATDEPGVLFIGGSLFGNAPGKSGSGRLATVVFRTTSDLQGDLAVNIEGDVILLNSEILDATGELKIEI